MTIYTDVFTGSSIAGAIPYAEIDVKTSKEVQFLWPNQNINLVNSYNDDYDNYYIGNITDIINSGSTDTLTIYLPDATKQVNGTNFTFVNKTESTTITVYNYYGADIVTLDDTVSTSYTFYISDNTKQTGWEYVYAGTASTTSTTVSDAYDTINNSVSSHTVTYYWNGSTAPGTTDDRIQCDVINVMNLGTTNDPGSIILPPTNGISGIKGYSFKLINSLPIENTLTVVEDSSDGGLKLLNTVTAFIATDYIFTIAYNSNNSNYYWQIEYVRKANYKNNNSTYANNYFNYYDYLIDRSLTTVDSSANYVTIKWSNEDLATNQIHAARVIHIIGNTSTSTNIIELPDPTSLPTGAYLGITINIVLKSLTTAVQYQIYDSKASLTIGTYNVLGTTSAGTSTRIITCIPLFRTTQSSGYAGNYWAVSSSS